MLYRKRLAYALPAAAIALVLSSNAISNGSTVLDYDANYAGGTVYGYSMTYVTPDFSYECSQYSSEYVPGFGYMMVCSRVQVTRYAAGVDGYLYPSSSARSFYGGAFLDSGTAQINYVRYNSSGSWTADADHWLSTYTYDCPVDHYTGWPPQPMFYIGFGCTPVGQVSRYLLLATTSDQSI